LSGIRVQMAIPMKERPRNHRSTPGPTAVVIQRSRSGHAEPVGLGRDAVVAGLRKAAADTEGMQGSARELQEQVLASRKEIELLRSDLSRARDEAVMDSLTGILNREGLDEKLGTLLASEGAVKGSHCLVMLDIDHFKRMNDTYGHVMGDASSRLSARFCAPQWLQGIGQPVSEAKNSPCCSPIAASRTPCAWPRRCDSAPRLSSYATAASRGSRSLSPYRSASQPC